MEYTVDYFIKKFEAIDDSNWCIGQLTNNAGQHCVLGHCGVTRESAPEIDLNEEGLALTKLLTPAYRRLRGEKDEGGVMYFAAWYINDGNDNAVVNRYGITPKERIINALKEAGSYEACTN